MNKTVQDKSANAKAVEPEAWKIIVADDEEEVHAITRLALEDVTFLGRPLEILSAYTGRETVSLLRRHPEVCVILLDVVMEADDAGLSVVSYIRTVLKNSKVRIILRTGQPGQAPPFSVMQEYDINDYREKGDLTARNLVLAVLSAVRGYKDLDTLDEQSRALSQALAEKEALLHELHYRVKHNLQVISSLLNLQILHMNDPSTRKLFETTRTRIRSMALAHEKIFESTDYGHVNLKSYLSIMAEEIAALYDRGRGIELDLDCEPVEVPIDTAMPIGMIANELLSNAYVHAFPAGTGAIKIRLQRDPENGTRLEISDNGKGLPNDINLLNPGTMGLELFNILVEQLKGTFTRIEGPGTGYAIVMPLAGS